MLKFNIFLRLGLLGILILCGGILLFPARVSANKPDVQTASIRNGVGGGGVPNFINTTEGTQASMDSNLDSNRAIIPIPRLIDSINSRLEKQIVQPVNYILRKPESEELPKMLLYSSYTVQDGDTISALAQKFALKSSTIISVNGIKDAKTIRPGQTLQIPMDSGTTAEQAPEELPKMLLYSSYTVKVGDTIGSLAQKFAIDNGTLISVNEIKDAKTIKPGQTLLIPNQDGVIIKGKRKEKLEDIVSALKKDGGKKYNVSKASVRSVSVAFIQAANEIFTDEVATENQKLFIPGAKMELPPKPKEAPADIFRWPARGVITDRYGYRRNPFGGVSGEFHNGLDISAAHGAPVSAAMAGRVTSVVYDHASYGNYVVLTHSNGYRTLYAHMSAIKTQSGAYVNAGELIGAVGSTGRSTGPHLHFTVYKNGVTVNPRALLR